MDPFEDRMRQGGSAALVEVGRFFMKQDAVHESLRKITKKLSANFGDQLNSYVRAKYVELVRSIEV